MIELVSAGKKKFILGFFICIFALSALSGAAIFFFISFTPDLGGPIDYRLRLTHITDPEMYGWVMDNEVIVNLTASDFDSIPFVYTILTEFISNDSKTSIWVDLSNTEVQALEAFIDHWGWTDFPTYFFFSNRLFGFLYGKITA